MYTARCFNAMQNTKTATHQPAKPLKYRAVTLYFPLRQVFFCNKRLGSGNSSSNYANLNMSQCQAITNFSFKSQLAHYTAIAQQVLFSVFD